MAKDSATCLHFGHGHITCVRSSIVVVAEVKAVTVKGFEEAELEPNSGTRSEMPSSKTSYIPSSAFMVLNCTAHIDTLGSEIEQTLDDGE